MHYAFLERLIVLLTVGEATRVWSCKFWPSCRKKVSSKLFHPRIGINIFIKCLSPEWGTKTMIFMVLTKSWKTRKRSKMAKNGHFAPLSKPLNRGGVPLYGKRLVAPGDHFSRFLDPPPGGVPPPKSGLFKPTPRLSLKSEQDRPRYVPINVSCCNSVST